ncbi:MAG: hypothetical protein ACOY3F_08045 [Bacillota bacterium]
MDAFSGPVEQHDRPEFRGKPVVVGREPAARGVVAACSYQARRWGVRSAMPVSGALRLCPQSVLLLVRMECYREVSARLFGIFDRFAPDVEPVSIGEAHLATPAGRQHLLPTH